jgi:hypothetical protein
MRRAFCQLTAPAQEIARSWGLALAACGAFAAPFTAVRPIAASVKAMVARNVNVLSGVDDVTKVGRSVT